MAMLDWAMKQDKHPVAIRVPGCNVMSTGRKYPSDYSDINAYYVAHRGEGVAVIGAGAFFGLGEQVVAQREERHRTVHRSGVNIYVSNLAGQVFGHRTLAARRVSVDCYRYLFHPFEILFVVSYRLYVTFMSSEPAETW